MKRQKVPLKAGHTLADWSRLCSSGRDMSGMGGVPGRITPSEVKKHNKPDDCWVIFNGKVFNITPYLEYHPGGIPILTQLAGKDVTQAFYKTHSWVNGEALLRTCIVGILVPDPISAKREKEEEEDDEDEDDDDDDDGGITFSFPARDSPQRAKPIVKPEEAKPKEEETPNDVEVKVEEAKEEKLNEVEVKVEEAKEEGEAKPVEEQKEEDQPNGVQEDKPKEAETP